MLQSGPKILYICRLGARIRGCEEVEVAISGRNVGRGPARGRGRGGRGTRLVVGETSADPGHWARARHRQESRRERHHPGSW